VSLKEAHATSRHEVSGELGLMDWESRVQFAMKRLTICICEYPVSRYITHQPRRFIRLCHGYPKFPKLVRSSSQL
jgi:hypothetical protein